MAALLWIVPALPLLGFLLLFLAGGRASRLVTAIIGVGSTALAALLTLALAAWFLHAGQPIVRATLWQWIGVGGFTAPIGFELDALSLVMTLVITFVGFLIHLYSSEFMQHDDGYGRFFCYMNLFVASMLILVLADNLLLLFLGWEGVGLCSYLLIGFWYRDAANGRAARKAFIVTRVGDTAFMIGLLLLATHLGTLDIAALMERAQSAWPAGSALPTAAAALLLGGAVGKSAQLPLQTWLPDAMAGPTPVSALIHAATMVTAGVYLIARTHTLFNLAPSVQLALTLIGAATLLLAAFSALAQHDLKRILAYSTMSQIGYMFLALGVGAWTAAIFHFMTHAFFKALLFLAAGAVIMRIDDEHDIFRMGGLKRELPVAFWSFLIGAASLAALPLVTAGFYSKDMILWGAWNSGPRGPILWGAGLLGALLTPIYIFRAVFVVFFGERHTAPSGRYGARIVIPLALLSALALTAGFVDMPPALGNVTAFSRLLDPILPARQEVPTAASTEAAVMVIAALTALLGVGIAWWIYGRRAAAPARLFGTRPALALRRFWLCGWGFDWLYDCLLVRPFLWLARINRADGVDAFYGLIAAASRLFNRLLSRTESGRLRRYAGWIAAGSLAAIAIAMFA
ncbi:MAG TPA: NADH-quinone oxidoreductase subunit L [Steroidobacteraceae bacterium]|jgi:NADH-quinone oxidoreductase subunit L|nr:NADH-quinone oxidoreductase subunit L [Steroidobacteraceae bacterium]